ncbi:MAG: efflux RND transporter periplasmic adaptor subunit [Pseudomonadota bacterium]
MTRRVTATPRWSWLAVLAMTATLAACSTDDTAVEETAAANEAATDEPETVPVPVEITAARRGEIYAAYAATATLEAFEEATVVAKVEGEIAEILVEEGDRVQAGQALARLDGDRLRLQREQARANLAKAERDYRRNIELHEKGLIAAGAFEALKYDLDALKAAYDIAELEYSYAVIKAPIDGVVADRMIKTGNTIAVNTPTFHIANLTPLIADVFVPEREFGKLAAGQPVIASIDALGNDVFRGLVARISPLVDAETGTFKVTVEMDPADRALKPGMFTRLNIVFDTRDDALLIPRNAIVETELGDTVFVVRDGKAERHAIRTGFAWGQDVEVVDGVAAGDRVVTLGLSGLRDGADVDVIDDEDDRSDLAADRPAPPEAAAESASFDTTNIG